MFISKYTKLDTLRDLVISTIARLKPKDSLWTVTNLFSLLADML
jgi:hypothetical protein